MWEDIEYWVLDVDGTLTDGGIYYDNNGNEFKKFNTKDGTGIALAHAAGMKIIVLTGRECQATQRRMEELRVDFLFQNVKNKAESLKSFITKNGIDIRKTAYIGDDLNDLAPMKLVGFSACPADACNEVKLTADYVSPVKGGCGAVREIMEHVLKQRWEWEMVIEKEYGHTGI